MQTTTPTVTINPPQGGPFTWDAKRAVYLDPSGEVLERRFLDASFRFFATDTRQAAREVTQRHQRGQGDLQQWRDEVLDLMRTAHKVAAAFYDGGLQGEGKRYEGRPEIFAWLDQLTHSDREWLEALTSEQFSEQIKGQENPFNARLWAGVEELPGWTPKVTV